jgi:hypothetical protein
MSRVKVVAAPGLVRHDELDGLLCEELGGRRSRAAAPVPGGREQTGDRRTGENVNSAGPNDGTMGARSG